MQVSPGEVLPVPMRHSDDYDSIEVQEVLSGDSSSGEEDVSSSGHMEFIGPGAGRVADQNSSWQHAWLNDWGCLMEIMYELHVGCHWCHVWMPMVG